MPTNSSYVPEEILSAKRKMLAGYYAHIMALDEQFARLDQCLRDLNIADDTLVVFTSDHGDMLGNHGHYFKSQPWRESVGIPMLMRWPGKIPQGRVTDGPISLIDLSASLIALAGAEVPDAMQGNDLSAFILGDESAAADSVFINFAANVHCIPSPPFRGVITRRHTYAETVQGPWLLYDDRADPFQQNNLISWANKDDPAISRLQQDMHAKLAYWLQRTDDAFEDGDVLNDRYQPGHIGGVLPMEPCPAYFPADRAGTASAPGCFNPQR
jgi:arylsulfatase A-like enzyme